MGLVALRHVWSSQTRIEPMSPALAGRFLTPELPGKPQSLSFFPFPPTPSLLTSVAFSSFPLFFLLWLFQNWLPFTSWVLQVMDKDIWLFLCADLKLRMVSACLKGWDKTNKTILTYSLLSLPKFRTNRNMQQSPQEHSLWKLKYLLDPFTKFAKLWNILFILFPPASFFLIFHLFIYLCWVFVAVLKLSLFGAIQG